MIAYFFVSQKPNQGQQSHCCPNNKKSIKTIFHLPKLICQTARKNLWEKIALPPLRLLQLLACTFNIFLPQIKSGHTGQKSHYSTPLEATCLFSAAYMKSHISLLPLGVLLNTNISDNLFLMSLKGTKCKTTFQSLNDAKMLSAKVLILPRKLAS